MHLIFICKTKSKPCVMVNGETAAKTLYKYQWSTFFPLEQETSTSVREKRRTDLHVFYYVNGLMVVDFYPILFSKSIKHGIMQIQDRSRAHLEGFEFRLSLGRSGGDGHWSLRRGGDGGRRSREFPKHSHTLPEILVVWRMEGNIFFN